MLQAASIGFALLAALFWRMAAVTKVPKSKGLTIDMTNFDWLTVPLTKQARWNSLGAGAATCAAITQAVVWWTGWN